MIDNLLGVFYDKKYLLLLIDDIVQLCLQGVVIMLFTFYRDVLQLTSLEFL